LTPLPGTQPPRPDRDVYSVSRLNREVRLLLEHGMPVVWIEAELSNFSRPGSGHWYFTLKDRDAQVRCAMFRQRNALVRFTPAEGKLVLARARVGLYEPRGDFQLLVEHLEEAGVGALRREFERLKEKLAAEGLFDPAAKRPLPGVPRRIGVITSPTGAAIRDILNILGRRFPAADVLIYPTAVQGAAAVPGLLEAIGLASMRREVDVLIVARGGGSLEDLWAFNDERVARALRACPVPVVTGIGHEVDFTIADFVADLRAPTPSGAAELVVPDGTAWRLALARLDGRFRQAIRREFRLQAERLGALEHRLGLADPARRVLLGAQRLDELSERLRRAIEAVLAARESQHGRLASRLAPSSPLLRLQTLRLREASLALRLRGAMARRTEQLGRRLAVATRGLHTVSPLATLGRGYAIVTRPADGQLLRDATSARPGESIEARLGAGRLRATVTEVLPEPQ
jgi:exodeoxyribonuclease VII large subunit